MILKIGTLLLMSASCVMLTIGCQQQTDEVVKKEPELKSELKLDSQSLPKTEASKYREVSINVTGLT